MRKKGPQNFLNELSFLVIVDEGLVLLSSVQRFFSKSALAYPDVLLCSH